MERNELFGATERALNAAEAVLRQARAHVGKRVAPGGAIDGALIDREQMAVHGFAWMATYVEALRQIRRWASRLDGAGEFGEAEALILRIAFGEYLAQLAGGIAMSQSEIVRPLRSRPVGDGDRATAREAMPRFSSPGSARRGRVWRRCSRRGRRRLSGASRSTTRRSK